MHSSDSERVAVIGFGPRGLGALEALANIGPRKLHPIHVDVFEPFETPGAGPNFDPGESPVCRLNIPLRDIDIRPPEGEAFSDWLGERGNDPDLFPPRAALGRFLSARFDTLLSHPAIRIGLEQSRIDGIERCAEGWRLTSGEARFGPYAEVLLVPGQPSVQPDEQLAEWRDHAKQAQGALTNAYPAHALAKAAQGWVGKTVAIRGLALSAFDVLRTLTVAQGGAFEGGAYVPSGREPASILPFSLDGRPPFPKPATGAIDAGYQPTDAEAEAFLNAMRCASAATVPEARGLICAALTPVVTRVLELTGGGGDVAQWLETECDTPGTQEAGGVQETLRDGIAMAEARMPPSIGYAVGQVWRKWQDQVRQGYDPTETPPDTANFLIGFDEGLKRYSYGPPVSSSQELLALIAAGVVEPALSADPTITLVDRGWRLASGDREATADVMIDAVLPSPDVSIVTAQPVADLLEEGLLTQVTDGLGARTAADGTVLSKSGERSEGLCLLGRLALGSVIAADSLHDCFGQASYRWADGVLKRLDALGVAADP